MRLSLLQLALLVESYARHPGSDTPIPIGVSGRGAALIIAEHHDCAEVITDANAACQLIAFRLQSRELAALPLLPKSLASFINY